FVALKVLAPHLSWQEEFVQRFLREARAAARLKHPNIVTIYDVGRASGWYYFAMDYVEGRTLAEIAEQRGATPADEVLRLIRPLAEALDYAHEQGLIHRDVKPSNIIVGKEGTTTLTDFGIVHAAQTTRLTQTGTVLGTPEYMSPEQARGDEVDQRTDQYSLAIVAYEMLAGKVPFKAESTPTLLHKIVHEAPPPLQAARPDLPAAVTHVLARALAKQREERYESCVRFVDDLQQALEPHRAAVPSRAATVTPTEHPRKRRETVLLGLGGVGLAIIGLLCLVAVGVGALIWLSGLGNGRGVPTPSRVAATSQSTTPDQVKTPSPTPSSASPTTVVAPTHTPSSQLGSIVFQDGFDNPGSGWEDADYEGGSVGYENGVYSVVSFGNGSVMWGVANQFLTDLIIEVDATQVSAGPENDNEYGVACHVQPDGDGHYLSISGDGYYAIWLNVGTDWLPLVDWTPSDAIQRGNATNHIRAVCNGPALTLIVNGQHLTTVEDTTFADGDIALAAASYEDTSTKIVFDDVVVYVPPD
ncbi:MAG: protein kinase domain-containing protein, partial [Anaerolineae bacterium]